MVESLESLVVDSAATLYGKKDLRAVVLHYDAGRLIPGKFRRGYDGTPPPQLDGAGLAVRQAIHLIRDRKSICVDNPDDVRHSDSLALRPSDTFRSYIRVPIAAGDYGYGILWVDGRESNSLMNADVASLRALAFLLASALAVTAEPQNRLFHA
jgi:transcriptional regulator with GAF, ATPase, and Fis domain